MRYINLLLHYILHYIVIALVCLWVRLTTASAQCLRRLWALFHLYWSLHILLLLRVIEWFSGVYCNRLGWPGPFPTITLPDLDEIQNVT